MSVASLAFWIKDTYTRNRPFIVAAMKWTHSESYLANLTVTQGSYLLEPKSALACDVVLLSNALLSFRGKKKQTEAEYTRPTQFFLPLSRAMSQVALSPLSCLQRQQLPLVLNNVTAMDCVHLQLHIPIHIPERQSKTCQVVIITTTVMIYTYIINNYKAEERL